MRWGLPSADDCGRTLIERPEIIDVRLPETIDDFRLFLREAITASMRPIVASRRTYPGLSALLSSPPPRLRALTKDLRYVKPTGVIRVLPVLVVPLVTVQTTRAVYYVGFARALCRAETSVADHVACVLAASESAQQRKTRTYAMPPSQ